MNLAKEEIEALDRGEAVPVIVEGRKCVLIREDVHERVKAVLTEDEPPKSFWRSLRNVPHPHDD